MYVTFQFIAHGKWGKFNVSDGSRSVSTIPMFDFVQLEMDGKSVRQQKSWDGHLLRLIHGLENFTGSLVSLWQQLATTFLSCMEGRTTRMVKNDARSSCHLHFSGIPICNNNIKWMQQHAQQFYCQVYALLPWDGYQSQVPIAFDEIRWSYFSMTCVIITLCCRNECRSFTGSNVHNIRCLKLISVLLL